MSPADAFALGDPGLRARIGVGRADITPAPDAPINNWGAATRTRATGIAAPLTLTALAIHPLDPADPSADARNPVEADPGVLLVGADLGWWRTPAAFALVRDSAARAAALPADRVLLALSHTHAGPAIDPDAVPADDRAEVEAYLGRVAAAAADAAARAVGSSTPALLQWGRGECALARRRDQWIAEEGRFVCGLDPDTPADTVLLVGRVTADADPARPLAVVVDYACHPTTLGPENTRISPDYVGATRELVEGAVDAPMLFLQGASGELAPRRQYTAADAAVRANGRQLGYAVLGVLEGMLPQGTRLVPRPTVESGAPLGMWSPGPGLQSTRIAVASERVSLPVNELVGVWRDTPGLAPAVVAERRARANLLAERIAAEGVDIPVAVVRLGDAVVVATPGEAYSDLQRDLRAALPGVAVVVVNLAIGAHHGYLPPSHAYDTELYQVWQTPAGRGSLEAVRESALALVRNVLDAPDGTAVPSGARPTPSPDNQQIG